MQNSATEISIALLFYNSIIEMSTKNAIVSKLTTALRKLNYMSLKRPCSIPSVS